MKAIRNFFLSGFKDDTYFERRKASYLFYIILISLAFIVFMGVGQFYFSPGGVFLLANFNALAGAIIALILFKYKRVEAAGHILSCCGITMIFIETVVSDSFSTDPAIRYKLYLNMVALTGVSFIILSFFRDKKYVMGYALLFESILLTHAIVIYNQLHHLPNMGLYVWEHLITVSIGMTVVAAISTWLLSYMEALFQQNKEYSERIRSQNEVLEKMVEERTKDLQTSNKHLSEFAYIVSHDLKEPLRTISGFVTLIKRELARLELNENEIEEYIGFVTRGAGHMEKLINDILTYSKLNNIEKSFCEVDINEVISASKRNLAKSIYESDAEIVVNGAMNLSGQRELLEQLFQNLISNAIKYRNDDRALKITIGCAEDPDGMIKYFVSDNGIGIAEEYFDTIFKAFKRLHSKLQYEGTGVGLAICHKIVTLHGGNIWVNSTVGEGSTFWFTLPEAQMELPAIQPVVQAA